MSALAYSPDDQLDCTNVSATTDTFVYATDGTSVYFRGFTTTLVVMKVPVGGGAVTVVGCNATWAAAPANPIAVDSSFVYWPDGLTIWKAPK